MRSIDSHVVTAQDAQLEVRAMDEPGSGGANHRYAVTGFSEDTNPSAVSLAGPFGAACIILFQNGPIPEVGRNGLTNEALLAIVADRLRCFQKGPFSCKQNACALTHIEEALHWLQQRTIERMRRGVEGTLAA